MKRFPKLIIGIGLLVLALLFRAYSFNLVEVMGLSPTGGYGKYVIIAFELAVWFASILLVCILLRIIFWDGLLKKATGWSTPDLIKQLSDVTVAIIGILFAVNIVFGQSVIAFVTAMGAIGVVLSLGIRELIADLMTGLAVNLEHSFTIGDWVSIQDGQAGSIFGKVTQINWRTTHLVDDNYAYFVVPNREIGNSTVKIYSSPSKLHRFDVPCELDYTLKTEDAKRILLAAVTAVRDQLGFVTQPPPSVIVSGMPANGIEYTVRFWLDMSTDVPVANAKAHVRESILNHLRLAGLTPSYSKLEHFKVEAPDVLKKDDLKSDTPRLLSQLEFFAPLNSEEVNFVSEQSTRKLWNAGEYIISQGDEGASMFVVLQGVLDVFITDPTGQQTRVGQIQAGEVFGEMSLLTGALRSATIRAATPSLTLEITKDVFTQVLKERSELGTHLSKLMAERQMSTQSKISALKTQDSEKQANQIYAKMKSFFKLTS